MKTRPPTAATWLARAENATHRQQQAERMAEHIRTTALDPTDFLAQELRNSRRAAAMMEAQAWKEYARHATDAAGSALAAERDDVA